jgi:subtilase family serine protease
VIGAVAVAAIMALSAFMAASLWLQPASGGPAANGSNPMVLLPGSAGQLSQGAVPFGVVSGNTPVSFDVNIALPQTSALQSYLSGLNNPSSPYYRDYLPFQEFYSIYGPSSSQVQALTTYFEGYGLTVSSTGGPLIYEVSGTTSQVDQALGISLTNYEVGSSTGFAPSGTPALPSNVASLVESFEGLNTFASPHTQIAFPSVTPSPLLSEVTPSVMRGFYNETALISAGTTGVQKIGLAEECSSGETTAQYTTDLNSFDSKYSLPSATVTYIGSGSSSCSSSNGDWYEETDLDIQWAHTMAPGAPIVVCLDTSNPDVCDQTFVTDGIPFGSNSWGGGSADHSVWQSAMAAGITLLASAGDSAAQVNYPAAEPDGLGVGGTSITPSGSSFGSEAAWADSGGGCDASDAPPSYQVGMTGYPGACSTTSDRGVPDVAMDANPNSGVPVYIKGTNTQIGGTSLACPMWAASLDVIYDASGFSGFAAPTIYSLAKSSLYGSLFHDITSGSNGYSATVGWDPVTGVGSPNIGALSAHFNGGTTTLAASASATPTSGTAPLAVTFTGGATGGTSPYTWSWAFGDGSTSTSQSPSHTYSTAGTYTAKLTATDSKSSTATASVTITVTAVASLTATASASPTSGTAPLAVTFTGTASGGTSPYTWSWAFGDGSTSTSQSPSHTYSTAGTYTATLTVTDSKSNTASSSVTITVSTAPVGCSTPTALTIGTQVYGSVSKGGCLLYSATVTQTQWDDYYYLDVYETDATVTGSSPVFTVYAGMSPPTVTTSNAVKNKAGPNAAMTIDLSKDSANTWNGWGTYEFVVQASSTGSGSFCFVVDLSNSGHGSSPACTAAPASVVHASATTSGPSGLASTLAPILPFPFMGGLVSSGRKQN